MSEKLDELKQEAKELGITFGANIGEAKLQEKIYAFYEQESAGADITKETEVEATGSEVTEAGEERTLAEYLNLPIDVIKAELAHNPKYMHTVVMKKIEIEARKTQVVKVVMVDKREASTATSAYFNNGAMALKIPLDTWVEMPNALIEMAERARAVISVLDSKTGLTSSKYTKKYVVEYQK